MRRQTTPGEGLGARLRGALPWSDVKPSLVIGSARRVVVEHWQPELPLWSLEWLFAAMDKLANAKRKRSVEKGPPAHSTGAAGPPRSETSTASIRQRTVRVMFQRAAFSHSSQPVNAKMLLLVSGRILVSDHQRLASGEDIGVFVKNPVEAPLRRNHVPPSVWFQGITSVYTQCLVEAFGCGFGDAPGAFAPKTEGSFSSQSSGPAPPDGEIL